MGGKRKNEKEGEREREGKKTRAAHTQLEKRVMTHANNPSRDSRPPHHHPVWRSLPPRLLQNTVAEQLIRDNREKSSAIINIYWRHLNHLNFLGNQVERGRSTCLLPLQSIKDHASIDHSRTRLFQYRRGRGLWKSAQSTTQTRLFSPKNFLVWLSIPFRFFGNSVEAESQEEEEDKKKKETGV